MQPGEGKPPQSRPAIGRRIEMAYTVAVREKGKGGNWLYLGDDGASSSCLSARPRASSTSTVRWPNSKA
jgi:hypothetical protein